MIINQSIELHGSPLKTYRYIEVITDNKNIRFKEPEIFPFIVDGIGYNGCEDCHNLECTCQFPRPTDYTFKDVYIHKKEYAEGWNEIITVMRHEERIKNGR